jgi:hypothetical protein
VTGRFRRDGVPLGAVVKAILSGQLAGIRHAAARDALAKRLYVSALRVRSTCGVTGGEV